MWTITFLALIITFMVLSGSSLSKQVVQTPPEMVVAIESATVTLNCSHNIKDYNQIFWYKQQRKNKQLKLLGYIYVTNPNPEKGIDVVMGGSAYQGQTATLRIPNISVESSAVYFCAAGEGSNNDPAYFGKGTKLTVLEPKCTISEPKVVVLKPSEQECRDREKKLLRKTLVCVASGFYPDHVSVSWSVDGLQVIEGVATDHTALRVADKYQITSRLRVEAKVWYRDGTVFNCNVSFYNGVDTTYTSAKVDGSSKGQLDEGLTRDKFVKITQTAKLSYIIFIVKNIVYGLFVTILAWKLGLVGSHATAKK